MYLQKEHRSAEKRKMFEKVREKERDESRKKSQKKEEYIQKIFSES